MLTKSTILHLRIPFSLFLLPFFLFALSIPSQIHPIQTILAFIIIHFLFYPSSNGFNSYYDRDEESIGGLEKPPPVSNDLLWISLFLFFLSLVLSFLISWEFALMILLIGLASKAYSHPLIRLKKYPFLGLFTVALFQGGYIFLLSFMASADSSFLDSLNNKNIWGATLCSLMLLGSYPMTQIYQHNEDARRGDITISRILGINGTFLWTSVLFGSCMIGFIIFFQTYYGIFTALAFIFLMLFPMGYFFKWFYLCYTNKRKPSFHFIMRLNLLSSLAFITFFAWLIFNKTFN